MKSEFTSKFPNLFKATVIGTAMSMLAGCSTNFAGESIAKADLNTDKTTSDKSIKQDAQGQKPNIIYIVLDDAGYSDIGAYGSEIKTPNIDKLAENGLRYNNFHVTPVCSPTRASLLTGRNNHAVGMGHVSNFDFGPSHPNRRGELVPEAGTIAEVLSENNYTNFALGKWHILPTAEVTPAGPYHNWPLGKGFHRYYGNLEDSSDQYRPELVEDNTHIPTPIDEEYHYSEAIIEKGNQYIIDQASTQPDNPFFMYIGFGAQHMPHQVPKEYIDMYDGVYDEGWDKVREQRFEKQKEIGIIPKDAELAPSNPGVESWDSLSKEQREVYTRFMETYAGFLTHTDEQIGKMLDVLERTGQLDNTMIVLFSDNGASSTGGPNGSTNQAIAYNAMQEDLETVQKKLNEIGGESTNPDYPAGWAQVSNAPFKMVKNTTYAGGIRTSMIVHWPEGFEAKGEVRTQFTHVSDITATVYDILGIDPPETLKGVEQLPVTGTSFAYTFDDGDAEPRKTTQYFEMTGNRTIYHEGWKAIAHHKKGEPFENDVWELYHVDEDFSELKNLADQEPERLQKLIKIWEKEAEENNVFPLTDHFLNSLTNLPEDNLRARKTFIYYPEMTHLSESATPFTINRSYEITIPMEYNRGDKGVILALGNDKSGYTLYIKGNKLVYEHNSAFARYKIVSDKKLPTGNITVRFQFDKTDENEGIGSLYVNDEKVGETPIKMLPFKISFEGLDIGEDLLYPVSPEYANQGTFPYTGSIEKVIYEFEEAAVVTIP
ncbi:arylsulfatase [Bacillus sp. B15-48]|uniref:arylsulfatase n=1 Tax=Bacillus sp. B15-48 TaxID=1548601 RepID=UPI00193FF64A|nr:arylsulfatase [Bacillus sp. B15-48]MBM4765163.1 sulfatase-like hydrolase/transferase [Bacillus sp. B15-48]